MSGRRDGETSALGFLFLETTCSVVVPFYWSSFLPSLSLPSWLLLGYLREARICYSLAHICRDDDEVSVGYRNQSPSQHAKLSSVPFSAVSYVSCKREGKKIVILPASSSSLWEPGLALIDRARIWANWANLDLELFVSTALHANLSQLIPTCTSSLPQLISLLLDALGF
ncbi:hypothetical protein F5Y18DRAFT_178839 [Xylariaceae sp. FL1019]|nr:hypothetical protein F5Y18DRAFT_178839 [Xylariaceae sp. FL1019]